MLDKRSEREQEEKSKISREAKEKEEITRRTERKEEKVVRKPIIVITVCVH
jgi:hypothetical protein